jgi:hypothetical protein
MYNMRPYTYPEIAKRLHAVARRVTAAAQTLTAFSVLERQALLEEQGLTILDDIEKDIERAEEWLKWAKAQMAYLKKGDYHQPQPNRPVNHIY